MMARPTAEMQAVLDRLAVEDAGLPDPTTLAPAAGRAQAARANRRWNRDLPELAVEIVTIPGGAGQDMVCRLYRPESCGPGAVLHLHGGGFAFCDLDTHERASRLLALSCGVPVLACDYRLAPEHPYPAGLDDCRAAWRALRDGRFDLGGPLAVAGDSAGANLAVALMLAEAAEHHPLPDAGLLFYGVFGADFSTPSYLGFANGPGLTRNKMIRYWDWYAPPDLRRSPLVAPIEATDEQLLGLPPLYVTAAGIDPLRSEAEAFHARLTALGRGDLFRLHEGVVHGFMQMSLVLEEARTAFAEAGNAFRTLTRKRTTKEEWEENT